VGSFFPFPSLLFRSSECFKEPNAMFFHLMTTFRCFRHHFFCHVPYKKLGRLFSQGEAITSVALGQSYIDNNQSTTDFPKNTIRQID